MSGFLLVGSLARELGATGRVDALGFVSRLVKRLLPLSLLVVGIVLATIPFWMPQTRWAPNTTHILASALYVENWYLAWSSVDYLARDEVPSPLQHYWAMAVQVQALVGLCAIMTVVGLIVGKRGKDRAKATILTLASISALSFCYSIYATATNQPVAYFNTFARVWEFAMGGLVAVALPRLRTATILQLIGGWTGLFLVISCGIILQVSTMFPGYAALWPTSGAALILLCGQNEHPLSVRHLLSTRVLNWLGDISYALYLWHWPVLVLYLTTTYQTSATLLPGIGILCTSILLAWLTTRLVDEWFQRAGNSRPWRTMLAGAAAIALITSGDLGWKARTARATIGDRLPRPDPIRYPGASVFDAAYFAADGRVPIRPGPLWMKRDVSPLYGRGCHQSASDDEVLSCEYGDAAAKHTLALVGGSHSAHYLSALLIALKGLPWRIVTFTKSSCLLATVQLEGAQDPRSCGRWNKAVMARLIDLHPDLVFTTATHGRARQAAQVPSVFVERWKTLGRNGIAVAAIVDNPWFKFDVPECVQVNGPMSERCTVTRASVLPATSAIVGAPRLAHVHYLDLTDHLCSKYACPVVSGNVVMYSDRHHLTNTYAQTLAPFLAEQLTPILSLEAR